MAEVVSLINPGQGPPVGKQPHPWSTVARTAPALTTESVCRGPIPAVDSRAWARNDFTPMRSAVPSLGDLLGAENTITTTEAAPLFGLRPTKDELAAFDAAFATLAAALKKAALKPAVLADLRAFAFPVFGRIKVTTREEPATFRAIVSRFPTWFAADMLTSETMKRDRAWNGLPATDCVMLLFAEPVAPDKSWTEGARALSARGKKLGLTLLVPPLPELSCGLVGMRELRGDLPASAVAGRTDTWARSLGREHRFTASWGADDDGTTEIRVGTVLDEDRTPSVGTLAAFVVQVKTKT